jgi:hypothetical protein
MKEIFLKILDNLISLYKWLLSQGYLAKLLLILAFIISAFIIQDKLYHYGKIKSANKFTRGLKYSYTILDSLRDKYSPSKDGYADYKLSLYRKEVIMRKEKYIYISLPLEKTTNCHIQRLFEQITTLALRAHNHLLIAEEFMVQSFVCVSAASLYFIIAAIALAFITKVGLANAGTNLILTAVISAGFGTFFFGLTTIFKQEENATNNFQLYASHVNLEEKVRNALASYPEHRDMLQQPCSKDSVLIQLINRVEKDMEHLNKISLGFNPEGVTGLRTISTEDLNKE